MSGESSGAAWEVPMEPRKRTQVSIIHSFNMTNYPNDWSPPAQFKYEGWPVEVSPERLTARADPMPQMKSGGPLPDRRLA
jgi:hypothetical protein